MDVIDRGAKLVFDDGPQRDYNHASDSNYKNLRAKADEFYQKRNKYSQESQAAYKAGDGQRAHELSEQSKKALSQAENYNRQASEYVFRENNTDSSEYEIDLHGLYVKEAEYFLQVRIVQFVKTNQSHLNVIVGKGLHSKNGIAKLKPAIDEMCDEARLTHRIDKSNSGVLIIDLKNTELNQLPRKWLDLHSNASSNSYSAPQQPQYQSHNNYQGNNHQGNQNHQQQQYNANDFKTGNSAVDLFVKLLCFCINKK